MNERRGTGRTKRQLEGILAQDDKITIFLCHTLASAQHSANLFKDVVAPEWMPHPKLSRYTFSSPEGRILRIQNMGFDRPDALRGSKARIEFDHAVYENYPYKNYKEWKYMADILNQRKGK